MAIFTTTKNTLLAVCFMICPSELRDIKDVALAVLNKVEDKQVRDDYKQLLKLALLYIEDIPDIRDMWEIDAKINLCNYDDSSGA